ncbi:acyl-CoA synthetase [Cantharellus anzutake]|uniref:acyl-CoA synthetase n=1 Tax=Cantharellus anzutake TaxID=1750568 RepID=UPI0019042E0F|nr:acyl-CoA synthetase [Cantharellus anzutake]KAF8331382.1 acyl-CoA synthetase [Cantharellus anzutake]
MRSLSTSFVRGPTEPALLTQTFPEFYSERLLPKFSSNIALVSTQEAPNAHGAPGGLLSESPKYLRWTFEDMHHHVAALSRGLVHLGVKKGDRVGVVMGNCSTYACLQWAAASIGAVLVTINPAYRIRELIGVMKLAGVSSLFITPKLRSSRYIDLLLQEMPHLASSDGQGDADLPLQNIIITDNISREGGDFHAELSRIPIAVGFRDLLIWREDGESVNEVKSIEKSLHRDEVINLQFTSGTTGLPKAVSLSHANLLNNAHSIGRCMDLTPADKICNIPPLFHCFGLVLGNLASWVHASAIVYSAESFDPRAALDAMEAERCTGVHGVPTHFLGLLETLEAGKPCGEQWNLSTLRTGIAAGTTIPLDMMRQLIQKLNLTELTIAYGMTETSPVSFQTVPLDPLKKRTETVGRVQPHVAAKIVDSNNNIVPVGTPGELWVSGYNVHKGYWDDPEQSAAILARAPAPDDPGEGDLVWLKTGDIGVLDEDGYLRIVGRMKDIIIRGGENLFPVQIENVLTAHPAIKEAAAVSVPDQKYGEVVGVWIVREQRSIHPATPELTNKDVISIVKQAMNPQNAPSWVWFVGEGAAKESGYDILPKTGSGKVQKNILRIWSREMAAQNIGLVSH